MKFLCRLLLIVAAVQAADPDFDLNDMMKGQTCPNFKCSAGYTPVPKSRLKWESMGCASMGGGSMMMMAGGGAEDDKPYEACCDQWHACYQICGVSKATCDTTFETCAKEACAEDATCKQNVEINAMMMQIGGCQKFNEAQVKVCECTAKGGDDSSTGAAATKRQAALRYFYKKFAPENIDKVENLAAKADTPSKMAGLFLKLLRKYPEAIQKVEDPMKKMYDKIRMETKEKEGDDTTVVVEETEEGASEGEHIEL
eukprot:scaffold19791_cov142-Amphora_coffeaeformis.AAC.2